MPELSRRRFLVGTGAIVASAVLPYRVHAPILYLDGVHDDGDALQTLFDGNPVWMPGFSGMVRHVSEIEDITVLVSKPIVYRDRAQPLRVRSIYFRVDRWSDREKPILSVEAGCAINIDRIEITMLNSSVEAGIRFIGNRNKGFT